MGEMRMQSDGMPEFTDYVPGKPENVVRVETGLSDKKRAAQIREKLATAIVPVLNIMNEAKRYDITINFQIGPDAIGKICVQNINISKNL